MTPLSTTHGSPRLVISLGAAHVAGAWIGRVEGRLTFTRYAREELDPDPEGEGDWAVRVGKALARLARARHWRGEATVLLPGHLTLTKRVRTPAVGEAGRETALLFAAQQNLPDALENLTWDGVMLSDDGADLELLLGTARAAVIEAVVEAVTRAGLKVAHVRPPGLPPPGPWFDPDQAGVFVNIGARSTLLYFRWAGGWWSRRIGTAGNSVTRLMAQRLDADFTTAQRLKHQAGTDAHDPALAAIRRGACREFAELLAAEIRRTALTFGCGGGSDRPSQLWLTGGGSRLPGVVENLADILDRPVHLTEPEAGVILAAPLPAPDQAGLADLLAALSCGAEGGEGAAVVSVGPAGWPDLLPWRIKLARSAAKRRRLALITAALLALAPFPVAWGYGQRAAGLAAEQARLERELGPRRAEAVAHWAATVRLTAARTELAAWERLGAQAGSWTELLGGLEAIVAGVDGAWLERLTRLDPPASRTGKSAAGPWRIALTGRLRAMEPEGTAAPAAASARMRRLTLALGGLPGVAGVGGERFDRPLGEDLRFECVLTLKADVIL
jgi:type IV pilus assembly protein PilM